MAHTMMSAPSLRPSHHSFSKSPDLMGFFFSWQFAARAASTMALMAGAVVIGSAATPHNPVAIASRGSTFGCTPTRVWDGDGPIWCAEGPRIRLSGIAAREMDGICRPNQSLPSGIS
jgi:endonuclease YncB( thermonuclease family)